MTDDRRRELREAFIEARGFWTPLWEGLLDIDPDFFEAYLSFSSVPWRNGPLEPKVKELVLLAMDAAATHLFEPGIRQHVRNAIGHGATREELMEVLELTSTLGIHACNIGVPILVDELEAAGQPIDRELDERRREVKADFEANAAIGTRSGTTSSRWIPSSWRPTRSSPGSRGRTGCSSPRSRR